MEIDEKIFITNLGKRLREIRISKNLSQEIVANDSNIPINQIGRIERAEINTSIITIYKIAKALDVNVIDFLQFNTKI